MAQEGETTKISRAEVLSWLRYNPETGVFRWKKIATHWQRGRVGAVAGTINKKGHRRIIIARRSYAAHHLAWLIMMGHWPPTEVDHKNRKPDDNRWHNLRLAPDGANARNKSKNRDKKLPKGVGKHASRFRARIRIDGELKSLGSFDTPELASAAYMAAARAAWGEFACGG